MKLTTLQQRFDSVKEQQNPATEAADLEANCDSGEGHLPRRVPVAVCRCRYRTGKAKRVSQSGVHEADESVRVRGSNKSSKT